MKLFVAGVIGLFGVCAMAQSTYILGDNFNDGSKNKVIWRPSAFKPTTRLIETNRRLRFVTGDVNPTDSTFAMWQMKPTRILINDDTVETLVQVSIPYLFDYDVNAVMRMGMRWRDPLESGNNLIFSLQRKMPGLTFSISYGGLGGGGGVQEFPVPAGITRVYLSMLYSISTDSATFWWRRPTDSGWVKLPLDMSLKTVWGISGNTVNIRPSLLGESYGYWISTGNNVYFDSFKLTHAMP